jgi:hypothetical protein
MGKRQVISGKRGKSSTLSTDHVTKPAVPEMIQTKLIHVGMKVYVPLLSAVIACCCFFCGVNGC